MSIIEFSADKLKLSGPAFSDNSYKIELWIGEYEKQKLKDILDIPEGVVIKVRLEYE